MFRIVFLLALVSTNALACESYDWKCSLGETIERNEQRLAIERANNDANFRHMQDLGQREMEHADNMIMQEGLQQSIDMQTLYGGYGSRRW